VNWLKALLAAVRILPAVTEAAVEVAEDVQEVRKIAKGKK